MPSENITFIIGCIYGMGYVFYAVGLSHSNPYKKYYYKLLSRKIYFRDLGLTSIISIVGIYGSLHYDARLTMSLAPSIFLILLWPVNGLMLLFMKRNILICTKWDWDVKPKEHGFIDSLFTIMLIITSIMLPMFLLNKINFNEFFVR